jgi:hypothetical protein
MQILLEKCFPCLENLTKCKEVKKESKVKLSPHQALEAYRVVRY